MSETPESVDDNGDPPETEDDRSSADGDSEREMSPRSEEKHLSEIQDGCGCVEVWEHLSERRQNTGD